MATELGKAYVQIMPSAKGISGSIQNAINPEATAAGRSAGSRIASSIADSMGKAGKTLTKAITVPALGAATAVTGLVGALGFKRLIGMDNAQAKLAGMGYEGERLKNVMGDAREAVTGTVMTMAEGVDIASGALAAGVKQGEDLQHYIKLVGSAAVGANRPVSDMAMIFNRVQGAGKLMTMELNMIEQGMPGFAQAMANHVADGSMEAFRNMVTNGAVGSAEFLDVMDDFAGGMADAYASTWSGMSKNVLSNIGIIGEALLEGLFEDGKKGMAKFLDFLRNSDGLKEWARNTGEFLREALGKIIEFVKSAINWWGNLDEKTKKMIGIMAGIAVVIGPVLMIFSKLIGTIISLMPLFKAMRIVIGAIITPIGLKIAAIAALVAGFIYLWKTNEGFRDFFINMWERIKEVTMNVVGLIVDFVTGIWSFLTSFWEEHGQKIMDVIMHVWETVYNAVVPIITEIVDFVMHIWGMLVEFWQEHGEMIMEAVFNVFETIYEYFNFIWSNIFQAVKFHVTLIWNIVKVYMEFIWEVIKAVWPVIQSFIMTYLKMIWNNIKIIFNFIKDLVINIWNTIKGVIDGALNIIMGIVQFFGALFTGNWSGMWDAVKRIFSGALGIITSIVSGVLNNLKNIFVTVIDLIVNKFSSAWDFISKNTEKVWDGMVNIIKAAINGIIGAINGMLGAIGKINIKLPKIPNWVPGLGGKGGGSIGFPKLPEIPKLDVGTDYVRQTGLALIHEGEAVVPAKTNGPYTGLGGNDVIQLLLELIEAVREGQNISLFPNGGTFAKKTGDYTSAEGGNRIRRAERGLA